MNDFPNFIGQNKIMREMNAIYHGLKGKGSSVNILLKGPAGCGKTFLATEFCKKLSRNKFNYVLTSKGFEMTRKSQLYRCHILDEIHDLKSFEILYPWMDMNKYVFFFITTEYGILPEPFTSRCLQFNYAKYSIKEIAQIGMIYAEKIGLRLEMDTAILVAKRARGNPRKIEKLIQRMMFLINRGYHPMTLRGVKSAFNDIGIYNGGYTDLDVNYLKFISKIGRASLRTISRSINVDENTIKNDVEPFLIDKGHIEISSKGRKFLDWKGVEEL